MSHVKSYAFDFEVAQNSNYSFSSNFFLEILITCLLAEVAHFFKLENVEVAQNSNHFCLEFNFSSNFVPLQHFRAEKSEPLRPKDT